MGSVLVQLRTGDWITLKRLRLWALAVLTASLAGLLFLLVTSDGLNDYQRRPLGTDFSNVYAAGTYVLEGKPGSPFDLEAQAARERAIFGAETPIYGWHYPPFFLFVAGFLALFPYAAALAIWQGATFALYLGMVGGILSRHGPDEARRSAWSALLLAAAFPAVFVNVSHGHNGFLTAALIGTALLVLDRRPALAGVLFGLLVYKPQFGVMIPLVLMVTGRWRAFSAAVATVAGLALVTTLAFGPDIWRDFVNSLPFTREVVLELGNTGWHKIQSMFSLVRMWGGSIPLAYAAQGALITGLAAALAWLWRSEVSYPLKAASLPIAAVLATPYCLDYDLVALAPSIAFLTVDGLNRGFRDWEKTALAFLWFMPLMARTVADQALIPLAVPAMAAVLVLVLRRAARETGAFQHWHSATHTIN